MTIPHHSRAHRALVRVLAPLLLLLPLLPVAAAAADTAPPGASSAADPARTVTVMTRNLYLGASLDGIIDALATGTQTDVVLAATATWQTVQTSDPAARMGAIADEIVAAKPTAVGLQEVSTWSTLPLNPATLQPVGAPTVRYDFLSLLLDALAARGVTYREVAGATPTNFTSPFIPVLVGGVPSQAVKLVDRDVILVRDGVKATNGRHGNFETILSLPQPGGALDVDRGWGSADLRKGLATFRFVNAHTEAWGDEAIRVGEVQELFDAQDAITAESGALPTVYVGDYNSHAPSGGGYLTLRSRLSDLWLDSHPGEPDPNAGSVTCCFGALLNDPTNALETRIDLLLGTAGVHALSTHRIGDVPVDLPGNLWWASDHAGVVGKLVIAG
jgi:hypothetical protein